MFGMQSWNQKFNGDKHVRIVISQSTSLSTCWSRIWLPFFLDQIECEVHSVDKFGLGRKIGHENPVSNPDLQTNINIGNPIKVFICHTTFVVCFLKGKLPPPDQSNIPDRTIS